MLQVNMLQGEGDRHLPFAPLDEVTAEQEGSQWMTPQDHMNLTMQFESPACVFACLSAFAVGHDAFAVFPVLGLQVQLHHPPRSRKTGLAGDTDVAVGIEVAIGIVVAFDSVDQALTGHSTWDSLVLAANMSAFSTTSIS